MRGGKWRTGRFWKKGGLSGVGGNQVTLRSLILVFYVAWGDDWGFAPSPSREHCSLHPFFASRRFKVAGVESGDASLPDSCFFMLGVGDVRAAALRPA